MKNTAWCILFIGLFMLLMGCAEKAPTAKVLWAAAEKPMLSNLEIPTQALKLRGSDVIVTSFSTEGGISKASATGNFVVELAVGPDELSQVYEDTYGFIGGQSRYARLLASGGFTLKKGDQFAYSFEAEFVRAPDGDWRLVKASKPRIR